MGFQILRYILLKRRIILWVTVVFFIAGLVAAIVTKSMYVAHALLMPPLEEGGEGLLAARMAQLSLPSMVTPMSAGTATAAIISDILQSRRLAEMIITSLDLMERFEVDTMDEAVRQLGARTSITTTSAGLITLRVGDEDPEDASKIAHAYITGLDSLNRYLQFSRAERTMEFIEGQIALYRARLELLREDIAAFQREHGMVDFEEQVRGAVDVAANIKVRTIIAEIELDLLREFARKDASELIRKEAEYENLTMQLARIMEGDTLEAVFVPLKQLPDLYQKYASMQRDLEVNERVYSFLRERYEESGIDRARTTPTVQVVDQPNIPEKPSGIPRWGIVLLVTVIGFAWITAVIAWWGWLSRRKRTGEEAEAFEEVTALVREDIGRLRKLLRL
jgi:tyrosine-protein kinase Etk/Wzc